MSFHVNIVFTGVCAVVPDVSLPGAAKEILIVMPDAWYDHETIPHSAQDHSDLKRHRPMVHFKLDSVGLPAGLPNGMEGVWYLDKTRLTFDATGGSNPFDPTNIKNLVAMKDVATSNYAKIDPNASSFPPVAKVAAQVYFNAGAVSTGSIYPSWVFPNTLSLTHPQVVDVAAELVLFYKDVDTFTLISTPFAGQQQKLPLKGNPGETVQITISHLCDENPLRWYTKWDYFPPDEDFKWYFELLSQAAKDKLPDDLQGLPLPFPRQVIKHNAQGANCFPVEMVK